MTIHDQQERPITSQQSEIARLRHQIAQDYEAAVRGLSGLAQGTARHRLHRAHMNQVGQYREQLVPLVGEQEASRIIGELYTEAMEQ